MTSDTIQFLEHDGRRLAYKTSEGRRPTLLFLPGYLSDMEGAKAAAVDAFAGTHGLGCVRFDYSGTGSSTGEVEEGTLDRWLSDALAIVDRLTGGPLILIGSSMGGWLALHIALQRPERVQAMVGIAAAPDFTEWGFGDDIRAQLQRDGKVDERSPGSGLFFTYEFWSSGQQMLLLQSDIAVDCPVRLIHGDCDDDVPVDVARRLKEGLRSADVQLTIVKGGSHRLSAPHEIAAILHAAAGLLEPAQ